jgi:hypothetical protein
LGLRSSTTNYTTVRVNSYTCKRKGEQLMPVFNFDISVTIEDDNFESALSWLKVIPLERLDFIVVDYTELELN